MRAVATWATVSLVLLTGLAAAQQGGQDLPRFTASTEVTSIDVSVFDDRGLPIADLKPEDFTVRVDGNARRVVSVEWVPLEKPPGADAPVVPEGYSSNLGATTGRLIVLVFDQPNIRFGGTLAIRRALNAFVDRLGPSDRVAVVGVGAGSIATPFTADRSRLKRAIERMTGLYSPPSMHLHTIGTAEAIDISRSMPGALDTVVARECVDGVTPLTDVQLEACIFEIQREAKDIAVEGEASGRDTIANLRALLTNLRAIDAPKTLILVSEGFLSDDTMAVSELGTLANAARTSIYAVRIDDQVVVMEQRQSTRPMVRMADRMVRTQGLETLTASARGTLMTVVGDGAGVFARIQSEMAGYYLVGVESGETDRNGKPHPVRVEVSRRGANVRTRRSVLVTNGPVSPTVSPRLAVAQALSSPLPVSALPLRVVTFTLRGPELDKVQLLIHADIGAEYSSSRAVALGYVITDENGRIVESQSANARLLPIMTGVPSPLQFSGGGVVPPGDYMLKLAVAEGDRVGTIEHPVHATLTSAGTTTVSDLMVGGPLATGAELLQPTINDTVSFGSVHGYFEAYGPGSRGLRARYEILPAAGGDALIAEDVAPRLAGAGDVRAIFTRVMPVRQLPPGDYQLKATVSSGDAPLTTITRRFAVAEPAVLMTSAAAPDVALPKDAYLPVPDTMMGRPFDAAAATSAATVRAFRSHLPEVSRSAFDEGTRLLAGRQFIDAERAFKEAVNPEADSAAALSYLAATFAASGHDQEAASAWQTALVSGSDVPEIYEWLVDALLRTHDLATARGMLNEAIEQWPGDVRFARPMAIVYAALGQGVQAVRMLDRHLSASPSDTDAALLAVEWIYTLRQSGLAAQNPADDTRAARKYADVYLKTNGPQSALVRQWMAYLEGRRR